ncbi:MAG TPA: TonB-dependent receptor [Chthoniobacterales bacterium]|jgi:iron complex outermembrane receptor protein|nr:TonB-dependent receptor [Chthoniobacterales bacterium]
MTIKRFVLAASIFGLCGAVFSSLEAEESVDLMKLKTLSIDEIMQIKIPTVYGASKHDQKINEAPSSVTLVTREEIQLYGYRTVAEILRSVRDFYVTYDRNYAFVGVRGVNRPGDFGGRILILIDGMRVNDPIYDSAGVATDFPVDVDMIERVEVIRGPGSALYGNNAFFAVINVVTRTAADVNSTELAGELGSFGTRKVRVSFGKVFKTGLSVLLTGTFFGSDGNERLYFKEFDSPENNRGLAENLDADSFVSLGLTVSFRDFTLQSGYVSRRKEVPTAAFNTIFNDPQFYTLDQRTFSRMGYAHTFEGELNVRASVQWNSYYYKADYPYSATEAEPRRAIINRDTLDTQWWGLDLEVTKPLFKTHLFTLGMEYQDNASQNLANYDVSPRVEYLHLETAASIIGLFVQDEWTVTKKLTLNGGVRYDFFETFGSTVNPRGAVILHPFNNTTLKALYGQAYRAPNMFESSYGTSASGFRSNPDLQPEKVRSYELVLEQTLTSQWRLNGAVFYNQIDGLISQGEDPTTGELFFENEGLAETKGGSMELEAHLPEGIKVRGSYTLQRTTDAVTGEAFSNSPELLAKLNVMFPVYRDKIFSGIELQYSSETENSRHQTTSGYLVANWTLFGRELIKNLEVSAGVYNLFDKKYGFPAAPGNLQDSITQDGRTFRVKLTYRF